MNCVAVVGVGLIGGSFGLSLRESGFTGEILGVSSQPALDAALARGAISRAATLEEACAHADLIYLSQTIEGILKTIEILPRYLRPGTLVTDAGSTKTVIVDAARKHMKDGCFLGGHPLAGKEKRGAVAADPQLFRGRPYALTGAVGTASPNIQTFRDALRSFGAHLVDITPEAHDATVALTSHLPQVLSTSLSAFLGGKDEAHLATLFGPGLVDMTRLALSAEELWAAILATNRQAIVTAIDEFRAQLERTRNAVATGETAELFTAAQHFAQHLRNPSETN